MTDCEIFKEIVGAYCACCEDCHEINDFYHADLFDVEIKEKKLKVCCNLINYLEETNSNVR